MLRGRSLWTFVHGTNPEADIVTTGVITVAEAMLAGTGAGKREKSHILRRINATSAALPKARLGTRSQSVDARICVPRRRSLVARDAKCRPACCFYVTKSLLFTDF